MPYDYEDDERELENSNLVKDLRKQIKDAHKELNEWKSKFEKSNLEFGQLKLRDVLSERKVPTSAAKWILKDGVDVNDASALDKWLEENGSDFGYQKSATTEVVEEVVDETQQAYQKIAAMQQRGAPEEGASAEVVAKIPQFKDPNELAAFLRQQNITIG
jgi:hypothetical protein